MLRGSVNALPLSVRHCIKFIPGVAFLQRWLVSRVLSGEPFVHLINAGPARGLRFEVTLPLDKAVWSGTYETGFSQALHDAVKPGDVCFDIGGYRGYMSGVSALAGASRVFVFEPFPQNRAALNRLIELNPGLPVVLKGMALGNMDGSIEFKVMPDASMGKITDSPFQTSARPDRTIQVKIAKLDTLIEGGILPPPSVMKIDVEGAEVGVLMGGIATLTAHRPKVLLEAHSDALSAECSQILSRLGYTVRQLGPSAPAGEGPRHLVAEFRE